MPRKSPCVINLTKGERAGLEARPRTGRHRIVTLCGPRLYACYWFRVFGLLEAQFRWNARQLLTFCHFGRQRRGSCANSDDEREMLTTTSTSWRIRSVRKPATSRVFDFADLNFRLVFCTVVLRRCRVRAALVDRDLPRRTVVADRLAQEAQRSFTIPPGSQRNTNGLGTSFAVLIQTLFCCRYS